MARGKHRPKPVPPPPPADPSPPPAVEPPGPPRIDVDPPRRILVAFAGGFAAYAAATSVTGLIGWLVALALALARGAATHGRDIVGLGSIYAWTLHYAAWYVAIRRTTGCGRLKGMLLAIPAFVTFMAVLGIPTMGAVGWLDLSPPAAITFIAASFLFAALAFADVRGWREELAVDPVARRLIRRRRRGGKSANHELARLDDLAAVAVERIVTMLNAGVCRVTLVFRNGSRLPLRHLSHGDLPRERRERYALAGFAGDTRALRADLLDREERIRLFAEELAAAAGVPFLQGALLHRLQVTPGDGLPTVGFLPPLPFARFLSPKVRTYLIVSASLVGFIAVLFVTTQLYDLYRFVTGNAF